MPFDPYQAAFQNALGGGSGGLPSLPGLRGQPIAQVKPPAKAKRAAAEPVPAPPAEPEAASVPPVDIPETAAAQQVANVPMASGAPAGAAGSAPPTSTPRQPPAAVRAAIEKAARAAGEDPAYALAVASRESDFDPTAHSSKTIHGLYQMSGGLRSQYGVGDSEDPEQQTAGFMGFTRDLRGEMAAKLGRQPTGPETYMGHYFGGTRAARMLQGDPNTPVTDVFTPNELANNPNLARAGTVGGVTGSIGADMDRRIKSFQGAEQPQDFGRFGAPADKPQAVRPGMDPNLSSADQQATEDAQTPVMLTGAVKPNRKAFDTAIASMPQSQNVDDRRDLPQPDPAATPAQRQNFERNAGWIAGNPGSYSTDLGAREPAFRQWVQDNKVPFDAEAKGPNDYDMRGFWSGLQSGDDRAKSAVDPNDSKLHYPDTWKTPYHETFSADSQWASQALGAPSWNDKDQLVTGAGNILYDDRAPKTPDFADFGTSSQ